MNLEKYIPFEKKEFRPHQKEVIEKVVGFTKEIGFKVQGIDYSPIKGPEGNIEYLMYISKTGDCAELDIEGLVDKSHNEI